MPDVEPPIEEGSFDRKVFDEQVQAWTQAFRKSIHFQTLPPEEREYAACIIRDFAALMLDVHFLTPEQWDEKGMEACLLDTFAARVIGTEGFFQAVTPVIVAFFREGKAQGWFPAASRLATHTACFADAVVAEGMDPRNWSPIKALGMDALAVGADLHNAEAFQRFHLEHNLRARKVGRNDRCSCGSGKKYKKCCLGKDGRRTAPWPVPPAQEAPLTPRENARFNALMQQGYDLLEDNDVVSACRIWQGLWDELLDLVHELGASSVGEMDEVFRGLQCLSNWCQDFEDVLEDAARDDPAFNEAIVSYAQEFTKALPETYELILVNMKIAAAEALARLGRVEEAEAAFAQAASEHPTSQWVPLRWGNLHAGVPGPTQGCVHPDPERARAIFRAGIERGVEDCDLLVGSIRDLGE